MQNRNRNRTKTEKSEKRQEIQKRQYPVGSKGKSKGENPQEMKNIKSQLDLDQKLTHRNYTQTDQRLKQHYVTNYLNIP